MQKILHIIEEYILNIFIVILTLLMSDFFLRFLVWNYFFSQKNIHLQLKLYENLPSNMKKTEKFCGVYAFSEMRSCTTILFLPPV